MQPLADSTNSLKKPFWICGEGAALICEASRHTTLLALLANSRRMFSDWLTSAMPCCNRTHTIHPCA